MANKIRSSERQAFWRDIVARRDVSGLSVRAFCQRENLPESAFYFWRRKLAERDDTSPVKARAASKRAPTPPAFVPVRIRREALPVLTDLPQERPIGGVLWFSDSTSVSRIVEVIRALEARA
jgi:transposase-like protein